MRRVRSVGTGSLTLQQAPACHAMAYIRECGEKWVFTRDEVDTEEVRTRACTCGRTIVLQRGIVYSTGHPSFPKTDRLTPPTRTKMKLRLNGNSLRLRLTRSEVMQLCEAGTVERSVDFGLGTVLIYRVQSRGVTAPIHALFCNHSITVFVPAESAAIWAAADEVGLYGQQGALDIAVEKDFRCLTHRPDEEEPDAYPRPANEHAPGTGGPPCQL